MTRELLLLRHGKSDWSVDVDDFQRPLKKRGKRGAQVIGEWLLKHQYIPDLIISSPAVRAKATAQICSQILSIPDSEIQYDKRIYEARVDTLLELIAYLPNHIQRIMLIGHNPGFESLLLHLLNHEIDIPANGKLLPTAALAILEIPDQWQSLESGNVKLKHILYPKQLENTR